MASPHDHHDHHGHAHHHADPADHGTAFIIAVVLNCAYLLAEFAFGLAANSTALVADAGHNLSDVLGLLLAWGAATLSRRPPDGRFTYGLRSTSILAALANALILLAACGAIGWEALQRLSAPPAVPGAMLMWVAGVGVGVNGISAWLFLRGSRRDLNIRGAYLHMAADAAVSLGVVLAGLLIGITGWYWIDPVSSLVIVVVIVIGTWALLRESVHLALGAVPAHIAASAIADYLRQCRGVADVHDLHIWGMSTTEAALTAHLVMPSGHPGDAFIDEIEHTLRTRFEIAHATLQIEQGTISHVCALRGAPAPRAGEAR